MNAQANSESDATQTDAGQSHVGLTPSESEGVMAEVRRLDRRLDDIYRSITERSGNSLSSKDAARSIVRTHRAVDTLFGFDGLATSPAWDILLEIYAAGTLATSDAAVGGGCAPTTGLRWIAALEGDGLVHRFADARDGRRKLVVLSSRAKSLVETGLKFYDK